MGRTRSRARRLRRFDRGCALGIQQIAVCSACRCRRLVAAIRAGSSAELPVSQPPAGAAQPIQLGSLPYEEPQVISVTGTGDIPQGEYLWIFVYAPSTGRYFPQDKVDSPNSNPWTVSGVNVGSSDPKDSGHSFTIYALVVDDSTSAVIDSFARPNPDEGYSEDEWQATFAPFVVDSAQVQRA